MTPGRLPECSEGPARGFSPREQPAPRPSAVAQIRAEGFIVEDTGDRRRDRRLVFGIHEEPGGADDLRTGRSVRADDGTPACHGLQQRQPEAFEERRIDEAARARVEGWQ